MKYSVKIEGGKKLVKGSYLPQGHSCRCKECDFHIEIPKETEDAKIAELVEALAKVLG